MMGDPEIAWESNTSSKGLQNKKTTGQPVVIKTITEYSDARLLSYCERVIF
jgi:hypothetical protein